MSWLRAAYAGLAVLGAGFAILRVVRRGEGITPAPADAALAWLLGCGALAFVLFLWGAAGVHGRTLAALARPALAGVGVLELALLARRAARGWRGVPQPRHAALLALGAGFVLALAVAGAEPMLHWDERFTWAFKAKIVFHSGTAFDPAFLDPERFHVWRGYPLLVPYVEAFVAWAVGAFDERAIKLVFPVFFFALVGLFAAELRPRIGPGPAAFSALLLAALPAFAVRRVEEGGTFFSGYADLPLAAYALAAVLLLQRFRAACRRSDLLLAGACLAFAVLTKRDGRIFLVAAGAIAVVLALRRELGPRALVLVSVVLAVVLAPFEIFAALLPPDPNPDASYLELLHANVFLDRLFDGAVTARYLGRLASPDWGCIGVLLPLAAALAYARGRAALVVREWPVLVLGAVPFAAYLVAFHVTPYDPAWHMDVALDRLLSQFVPLWAFAAAAFLFPASPVSAPPRPASPPRPGACA
jgi:hypothetical protein